MMPEHRFLILLSLLLLRSMILTGWIILMTKEAVITFSTVATTTLPDCITFIPARLFSFSGHAKKIRRIRYYHTEQNREFVLLTNDLVSESKTITELYRKRWSIELFFKWIKQHLKIKQFWGTTENAVKIQVKCAVIAYCLIAIVAKTLKTERTIYELLQIFGKSLLDKTPINHLINKSDYKNIKELNDNLLLFN